MKKLILLFAMSFVLLSCNKNNDDDPSSQALSGSWNLVSVTCFCTPIHLEVGEHIWEFDINQSELHVENNVTEELHTLLETGTYTVAISAATITVQNIEYDYYFQDGKLFLTNEPELDGPIIEFIRG